MDNCPLYGQLSIAFCREIIEIRFTQSCGQIQSQIKSQWTITFFLDPVKARQEYSSNQCPIYSRLCQNIDRPDRNISLTIVLDCLGQNIYVITLICALDNLGNSQKIILTSGQSRLVYTSAWVIPNGYNIPKACAIQSSLRYSQTRGLARLVSSHVRKIPFTAKESLQA